MYKMIETGVSIFCLAVYLHSGGGERRSLFARLAFAPFVLCLRFADFTVIARRQHRQDIRLNDGVEHREHRPDRHGQHHAERQRVIHHLGREKPRKQGAEQTETHGDGQGKFLDRAHEPARAVVDDPPAHDDEIRKAAQGDGGVDVRQGRRQRDRAARGGADLQSDELEEGAAEDIRAGGKDVAAEKTVLIRAVPLCHVIEETDDRLDDELKLAGHFLETGNGEDAHARRKEQQHARHDEGGEHGGTDVPAEEIDPLFFVEHHVTQLRRERAPVGGADDQRRGEDDRLDEDKDDDRHRRLGYMKFLACIHIGSPPRKNICRKIKISFTLYKQYLFLSVGIHGILPRALHASGRFLPLRLSQTHFSPNFRKCQPLNAPFRKSSLSRFFSESIKVSYNIFLAEYIKKPPRLKTLRFPTGSSFPYYILSVVITNAFSAPP